MAILTDELILNKSSAKSVVEVRNLNLWGCELDDVSVLKNCSRLEILSLSVNNLTSLEQLSECKTLKELYLRKNYINDSEQVKHLTSLRNLEVLWLCDNPCAEDEKKYRNIVLRYLPWLKKLDHHEVTDEEVLASMCSLPASMPPKVRKKLTPSKTSSHEGSDGTDFLSKSPEIKTPKPIRANSNGLLSSHGIEQSSPRVRSPVINSNRPPSRTPTPSQESGFKLVKSRSNNGTSKTNGNGSVQPKLSGKSLSAPLSRSLSRTPPNNIIEDVTSRQSNVLTAVLALIEELEEKDLHAVQRKLQLTMLNRFGKLGKK
ncbi:20510_t:CDS:2 [Funneliformis geosporum]|uniref:11634_t:CDS:1 n=1 Tax=Funneliformis geosporum TaxID=1117311 RepID=A0A9W4WT63_9GLOM|nr:11634_t:CDS:2 [Funneliformis geosporum]CAI2180709.1 20510_t:CDS:2 [Funneliformis geosporum]